MPRTELDPELITIMILFFFFLMLIFFVVITLAIRYRKRRKENEEMRIRFSEQLLASKVEIQEQTLQYISHELHDNLGQVASLIKINLNTILLKDPEAAAEKLNNTKSLVKQLIADLKFLSVSLSSSKINKIGLTRALQVEEEKIMSTGLFAVQLSLPDDMPLIDGEREIIIYRMVQEMLNNIIKHSQAKHIAITVSYSNNIFELLISDDGVGFDAEKMMAGNTGLGNGLVNLQTRAQVIQATYTVQSIPGKGTESKIVMTL